MTLRNIVAVSVFGVLASAVGAGCADPPRPYDYAVEAAAQEAHEGGTTVVIAKVATDRALWVVVHGDDAGDFGSVLGKTAVADESDSVKVTLEARAAQDGEVLHVLLYRDDGEVGTWEPDIDRPLKNAHGAYTYASFAVDVNVPPPALSLEVSDQTADPADVVVIAKAQIGQPGWVAVYDDDAGSPGEVLGRTALVPGGNLAAAVALSRHAVDGETLHAVLHVDLGTPGTWDFPGADAPIRDALGAEIRTTFVVSLPPPGPTPAVTAADQEVPEGDGNTPVAVTIARVVAVGAAWLAVHEDDGDGGYGAVIGVAPVAGGTTSDLIVAVERPLVDGETLHAILHADAGTPGAFEFPGADEAVRQNDGRVVVASFAVDVPVTPAIGVSDQSLADPSTVTVASVASAGAGWVAVHEAGGVGAEAWGAVLGKVAVPDGRAQDIAVALSRPARHGETLYVVLYRDAGDLGVFEFPDGPDVAVPLPVAGGAPVTAVAFTVAVPVTPSLTVTQRITPSPTDSITIEAVTSQGPGWVVIRDGGDGSELGHAAVAHGTASGVSVELSRAPVAGETLFVILHVDQGTVGTYQFPGADVPAKGEGGIEVQASFTIWIP